MKKVLGYAAALLAALSLGGVAATSAHADGGAANAASGLTSSSSASSDTYDGSYSFDSTANDTSSSAAVTSSDATSSAASSSSASSSSAASSSSTAPTKPTKPAKKPTKKPGKVVSSAKKLRGRLRYRKDSRTVLFQKGRKGAKVVLCNRKGQVVKKFTIKRNGKFSIKLTRKEALKLNKDGKYFKFAVSEKGYRTYTLKYLIFK